MLEICSPAQNMLIMHANCCGLEGLELLIYSMLQRASTMLEIELCRKIVGISLQQPEILVYCQVELFNGSFYSVTGSLERLYLHLCWKAFQ